MGTLYSGNFDVLQRPALLLFAALVLSSSSGCRKKSGFSSANTTVTGIQTNMFAGPALCSGAFADAFASSYRDYVRTNANSKFYKAFEFMEGVQLTVLASRDAIVQFKGSANDKLLVNVCEIPTQLAALTQANPALQIEVPVESAWSNFNKLFGVNSVSYAEKRAPTGMVWSSNVEKWFNTSDTNSLSVVRDLTLQLRDRVPTPVSVSFPGFTIFCATNRLNAKTGQEVGTMIAEMEFNDLYSHSTNFRAFLAHPTLKIDAQSIVDRIEEQKKGGAEYPPWERNVDRNALQEKARRFGLATDYLDDLFRSETERMRGILFREYRTHSQFMWQWAMMNCVLCAVSWFVGRMKRLSFRQLFQKCVEIIIPAANVWVFAQRPTQIPVSYWVLPAILGFVAFLLFHRTTNWRFLKSTFK